jgi:hypothetical protein
VKPIPSQKASTPFRSDRGQHLVADCGNIAVGVVLIFGRQGVRAEEGRRHPHRAMLAQRATCTQHLCFVIGAQAVAGLDLHRGHAFGHQRVEPGKRARHQPGFVRVARRPHRRYDPATAAGNLLIGCARQPQFEFMRAVAAVNQVGVAIDQPRRDPAALAGHRLRRVERGRVGPRPGMDDRAVRRGDAPTLDHAQPGARQGRQPCVGPERIAAQDKFHSLKSCYALLARMRRDV